MVTNYTKQDVEASEQIVRNFLARFLPEHDYEPLLLYAALPLVLTPELLHYLRHRFVPHIPWVAEIDILLAEEFFRERGYEQYIMNTPIRIYLLQRAKQRHNIYTEDAARLMVQYLHAFARTQPYATLSDMQAQQWSALAFIKDTRSIVAQEITAAMEIASNQRLGGVPSNPELKRLVALAEQLAPELENHPEIIEHAQRIRRILRGDTSATTAPEVSVTTSSNRRIFISYTRSDLEFAQKIAHGLRSQGHDVWIDIESTFSKGESFTNEIREAIEAADRFILIIGIDTAGSEHVRAEWEYALDICIPIYPIRRSGDYVPNALHNLELIDIREDDAYEQGLTDLVRQLENIITSPGKLYNVPNLPKNYSERKVELQRIKRKLLSKLNAPTLIADPIVIQGMAGVGKTVTATAICHDCDVRRYFSDGIFWLWGQNMSVAENAARHLQEIVAAFDDEPVADLTLEQARTRLGGVLQNRSCLIVLDSLDALASSVNQNDIIQMLEPALRSGNTRLLITTRQAAEVSDIAQTVIYTMDTAKRRPSFTGQRVFISYKSEDRDLASRIHDDLETQGLNVWIDINDIQQGTYWPDEIDKGLQQAQAIIGIVNSTSLESRNVRNEWDWGISYNRPVVLLFTEDLNPVPPQYGKLTLIDFRSDYMLGFNSLLEILSDIFRHGVTLEETATVESKLNVFISYSRRDGADYARQLNSALNRLGISTLMDSRSLAPDRDFTAEIEAAIQQASHVLVALTSDAKNEDSFVRREISYALTLSKRIIPLRFEDIAPPISIANLTWIDFFTDWDLGFEHLKNVLGIRPTVGNALANTIDTLSEIDRERFTLLGATAPSPANFDQSALISIWETDQISARSTIDTFLKLDLIQEVSPNRYQAHELVIDFARRLLEAEEEAQGRQSRKEASQIRIFINYARTDTLDLARKMSSALKAQGYNVFFDMDIWDKDANLEIDIQSEVSRSDIIVSLQSPNIFASEWWMKELAWALEMGKLVVPVLVDGYTMPRLDNLPKQISQLAYLGAMTLRSQQFERDFQTLVTRMQEIVPTKQDSNLAKTFYSVQTTLAYELQKNILKSHYIYVATEFDPVGNPPSINPRLLAERYCRIAMGNGDVADLEAWERIKINLQNVLTDSYNRGAIDRKQLLEGQALITTATLQSAAPVLLTIPYSSTAYEISAGDVHVGYENTEKEYLISNLDPAWNFEVRNLDCIATAPVGSGKTKDALGISLDVRVLETAQQLERLVSEQLKEKGELEDNSRFSLPQLWEQLRNTDIKIQLQHREAIDKLWDLRNRVVHDNPDEVMDATEKDQILESVQPVINWLQSLASRAADIDEPDISALELNSQLERDIAIRLIGAGWNEPPFSLKANESVRDNLVPDFVLAYAESTFIAVVEVKGDSAEIEQLKNQAQHYRHELDANFAYVVDGKDIIELDPATGDQTVLSNFPSAQELLIRSKEMTGATLERINVALNNGKFMEALELLNEAVLLFPREQILLMRRAYLQSQMQNYSAAIEDYEKALILVRQSEKIQEEAQILSELGTQYLHLRNFQRSLEYYEQSLPLIRSIDAREREAAVLANMGGIYLSLGETARALSLYEQALPLKQAIGDQEGEAAVLANMGGIYLSLGETARALSLYEQALPLKQTIGDQEGEVALLINLGKGWDDLGEERKALDYYEQVLPYLQTKDDQASEALTLSNMAKAWLDLDEKAQSIEYYKRALAIYQLIGDGLGVSNIRETLEKLTNEKTEITEKKDLASRLTSQITILEISKRASKQIYKDSDTIDWSVEIDAANEILNQIVSVQYTLHSSFEEPVRVSTDRRNRFRLSTRGWGVFLIPIEIHFADKSIGRIQHKLTFEDAYK